MDKENELYHSTIYLGTDFSDGIRHWKYVKKVRKNGRWVYYYHDPDREKIHTDYTNKMNKLDKEAKNMNWGQIEPKFNKINSDYKKALAAYDKYKKTSIKSVAVTTVAKGVVKVANAMSKLMKNVSKTKAWKKLSSLFNKKKK